MISSLLSGEPSCWEIASKSSRRDKENPTYFLLTCAWLTWPFAVRTLTDPWQYSEIKLNHQDLGTCFSWAWLWQCRRNEDDALSYLCRLLPLWWWWPRSPDWLQCHPHIVKHPEAWSSPHSRLHSPTRMASPMRAPATALHPTPG